MGECFISESVAPCWCDLWGVRAGDAAQI